MCKKYINNDVEKHIYEATTLLQDILGNTDNIPTDRDKNGFVSVRQTRKMLLSARSHISLALNLAGKLERVRYVRETKDGQQK